MRLQEKSKITDDGHDGPEFFFVLAQLDTEGKILTKFKKIYDQFLEEMR